MSSRDRAQKRDVARARDAAATVLVVGAGHVRLSPGYVTRLIDNAYLRAVVTGHGGARVFAPATLVHALPPIVTGSSLTLNFGGGSSPTGAA